MRTVLSLVALLLFPSLVFGANQKPYCTGPLDVIKFKDSSFEMAGEIVQEYEDSVVIVPENGGRIELRREFVGEILYDARPSRHITTGDLVASFAHCVSRIAGGEKRFRVVKVKPDGVYLNLGLLEGGRPGMELNVYREGEKIIDPESGKLLGREKEQVGILQTINTEQEYSKALPVDGSVSDFEEGDTGFFLKEAPVLAVAGITTLEGEESPYGALLSEHLIASLKEYPEMKVVERRQLGQILRELALQNALLQPSLPAEVPSAQKKEATLKSLELGREAEPVVIDEGMAQKLRTLQGADALIVGTVADVNGHGAVNLRVVDTSTAAVLFSTHKMVGKPEKPVRVARGVEEEEEQKPTRETSPAEPASAEPGGRLDLLDRILRAVYQR